MTKYVQKNRLKIATELFQFVEEQALKGIGLESTSFWQGFENLLLEFTPLNEALLEKRDSLQAKIDNYHQQNRKLNFTDYKAFLEKIGYLNQGSDDVRIDTQNVDAEIAKLAGPQLVVPINNARYALNAVNARWGSLYDAFYGTDAISEEDGATRGGEYNPTRGNKVVAKAKEVLDRIAPLLTASHKDAISYRVEDGTLVIRLQNNEQTGLVDADAFIGFTGNKDEPRSVLLEHNGLHAELMFNKNHPIGKSDPAYICDILLESALTTIMDCEDSVAAVDAQDKTLVYRNWLGLMQGSLSVTVKKAQNSFERRMASDKRFTSADGDSEITLSGRSLMFVRNVGHLMKNDAILLDDKPIFEGIMDGIITSLIGKHDLQTNSEFKNSKTNSIYIVKPKMHGPEEVAFTNALFTRIEEILDLPLHTLKMGIMDEERRTSLHLRDCIKAAKSRVVFINTGFLDRTGDEIHTSMHAGAFAPKAALKQQIWIEAYEKANVATGLACGLSGKAQIGKGMWPIPDQMENMLKSKVVHPQSGANTAWVPSPTAATLHALHYHQIDVFDVQNKLINDSVKNNDGECATDDLLTIPLLEDATTLSTEQIQQELDNNVQGILGYVVRWVHQGIGCSKVPDINGVGLMEDRATLRISSQHIANWLLHGLVSSEQVDESLARMAVLVDEQNQDDNEYIPMLPDLENSIGFQAARDLIFLGTSQANGYTEPLLHQRRKEMKAQLEQV